MSENVNKDNEVFWLGGAPGSRRKPGEPSGHLGDNKAFAAAINACCESAGCVVKQFVSARGPYGTWLVEFRRAGRAQRILWNGRTERLVLQLELQSGGWEDPLSIEVTSRDEAGFVGGIERILATDPSSDAESTDR